MKINKLDYETLDNVRVLAYKEVNIQKLNSVKRRYLILGLIIDNILEAMGPNPNKSDPYHRITIVLSTLFDQGDCLENLQ